MTDTLVKAADYAGLAGKDEITHFGSHGIGFLQHLLEKPNVRRYGHRKMTNFPAVTGFSPRNLRNMKQFYTAYSQPEFWRQAVAKLNRQSSAPSVDEKWQQAVAKLNRLGVMAFLEQPVPEMRGKFPTSRSVIPAKAGIQALDRWMPDQVRHDESGTAGLQPNVKRSGRLAAPAL